jgi:hypothetical protein
MLSLWHRVETYRNVTSVPTFFVRMLGKLLDACIWLDNDQVTTHFKLAEHARSWSFFARSPEKKWVHDNVIFRSVYNGQLRLCMSLLRLSQSPFWNTDFSSLLRAFFTDLYCGRGLAVVWLGVCHYSSQWKAHI